MPAARRAATPASTSSTAWSISSGPGYGGDSAAGVLDGYAYGYNLQGDVAYEQNVVGRLEGSRPGVRLRRAEAIDVAAVREK